MTTDTLISPTELATGWLDDFGAALARRDVDATLALFDADCYWRDLVAFTWNIRTQEGPAAIRDMLKARLADTQARELRHRGRGHRGRRRHRRLVHVRDRRGARPRPPAPEGRQGLDAADHA